MFLVRCYSQNLTEEYNDLCCILVSRDRSRWYYYLFEKSELFILSELESTLTGLDTFSLEEIESNRLDGLNMFIRWEVLVPNLNYIYRIAKDWIRTGDFDLCDYYDIPWYDGGQENKILLVKNKDIIMSKKKILSKLEDSLDICSNCGGDSFYFWQMYDEYGVRCHNCETFACEVEPGFNSGIKFAIGIIKEEEND